MSLCMILDLLNILLKSASFVFQHEEFDSLGVTLQSKLYKMVMYTYACIKYLLSLYWCSYTYCYIH